MVKCQVIIDCDRNSPGEEAIECEGCGLLFCNYCSSSIPNKCHSCWKYGSS